MNAEQESSVWNQTSHNLNDRELALRLRAYADNPASSGFVPIHPDTLRDIAQRLETRRPQ